MTTIPYLEEQLRDTEKDLNYYKNYCERLRNKNKKQKEIIEKAIKYIEKDTTYDEEHKYYDVDVDDILNVLDILKGE